jgi:hypothetical protein
MVVSSFLERLAGEVGPERLKGAIVLVALDRPIDHLTQHAQGLAPTSGGGRVCGPICS